MRDATDTTMVLGYVRISGDDGDENYALPAGGQLIETFGLSDRLFTLDPLRTRQKFD